MYLHFILNTGPFQVNLFRPVTLLYNRIELVSENIEGAKHIVILQLVLDKFYSFILSVQLSFFLYLYVNIVFG